METEDQIREEAEDLQTIIKGSAQDLQGFCKQLIDAIDAGFYDGEHLAEHIPNITHEASELARLVPELEALLKTLPR